jgi:pyridinium-3,5-biscarboxylic acid mononucleotide sulfurtransferase
MKKSTRIKHVKLLERLKKLGAVAVGFSGGVDSAVVLAAAVDALGKDNVFAITARGDFFPKRETDEARKIARKLKVKHVVFDAKPLSNAALKNNPPDRCYHCKKATFKKIVEIAASDWLFQVADGANVDDASDYRPGAAATNELEIYHPLMDAGLGKKEIRELARHYKLPNADKPASPCLATRFPFGTAIDKKSLVCVEKAEEALHKMGFKIVRVRSHGEMARIEVLKKDLKRIVFRSETVFDKLKKTGFKRVTVDLEGYRSGSMNEGAAENGRQRGKK